MAKKKRVFAIVSTNELPEEELKKVLLEELKQQYKIKFPEINKHYLKTDELK